MQEENSRVQSDASLKKTPPFKGAEKFAALGKSSTLEALTGAIATALDEYGFTDFSLTALRPPTYERISTFAEETKNFKHLTDIVNEHFHSGGAPLFLSDVEGHIASYPIRPSRVAKDARYLEWLAEQGFSEGYFFTYTPPTGKQHLFAVYSQHADRKAFRQRVEQHQSSLVLLLESILYFGFANFPTHFLGAEYTGSVLLKPKPRKLLNLLAKEGLLLKEAAPLLGVTLDTVNRYCADLKKTLGCRSMPQVIYRTYLQGIIAPPDSDMAEVPRMPATALDCKSLPPDSYPMVSDLALPEGELNSDFGDGHFFSQLAGCATIEELGENITSIVHQLGFTDWSLTALGAPPTTHLASLPEVVSDFCLQEDFAGVDFFREHAAGSDTPIFLSTLEQFTAQSQLSSERIRWNAAYFELLASLGYHDGYCIPQHVSRDADKAMFSLYARGASRADFGRRVEQCQSLLPMLVGAIVYFGFTNFPEHFLKVKARQIKPRPLATLTVVIKEGLTMKEAERRLFMSEFTAAEHINAAKKALGATTLMNAAYLALVHGLIKDERE